MLLSLPFAFAMASLPVAPPKTLDIFVGTYTSSSGSKGIYHVSLDVKKAKLSAPKLVAEVTSPSYLAVNGTHLYAVLEGTGGAVNSYKIEADNTLTLLNTQNSKGGGPCHISIDPKGSAVFTAAYGGGSVAALPIQADGSLGLVSSRFQNTGSGPNKSRQEGPHAHFITLDPAGEFAYSCDLGTDEILVFKYNRSLKTLEPAEPKSVKLPGGSGPRHLVIAQSGKFLYVTNELNCTVTVFARDQVTGGLTSLQTLPTLPKDADRVGKSTAAIALHPNGKFLCVSNRGQDTLAIFQVLPDGTLKDAAHGLARVVTPRSFALDPSGKFMVTAGQGSNSLCLMMVDGQTGRVEPTGSEITIGSPVCVAFAPPK